MENIDIAPFPAPKPRVVTLEPVARRAKAKAKGKSVSTDRAASDSASTNVVVTSSGEGQASPSPVPSDDVSTSSRCSNSTRSHGIASDPGSSGSGRARSSDVNSLAMSATEKKKRRRTITAKAEIQRAGVLPGDTLPVKVSINHNKHVRSLHGIIVTLYRQGRIELFPTTPIGSNADGKAQIHEDLYPRSRTGLGGLTLGTTRLSSVFRKDLSQTFAPLVLDPTTLSADIKTSIRVPEDSFPTISRVPGGLISFRYYVEVVVDMRGKLTAPDRFRPRFNMMSGGKTFSTNGQVQNSFDAATSAITANWGDSILDTAQIRRERGVIALAFEIVIGTRDSGRTQRRESTMSNVEEQQQAQGAPNGPVIDAGLEQEDVGDGDPAHAAEYVRGPDDYEYAYTQQDWTDPPADEEEGQPPDAMTILPPPTVPPPCLDDEPVDEKARLRREEQMLLPSQPPDEPDAAGPSSHLLPTAPVLLEDDHVYNYQHLPGPSRHHGMAGPFAGEAGIPTTASALQPAPPPPPPPPATGDDKQEMERRRLLMETSTPETEGNNVGVNEPSAPILDEDDEHEHIIVGGSAEGDESLPRYLR